MNQTPPANHPYYTLNVRGTWSVCRGSGRSFEIIARCESEIAALGELSRLDSHQPRESAPATLTLTEILSRATEAPR